MEAQQLLSPEMRETLKDGEEAAKRLADAVSAKEDGGVVDHTKCAQDIQLVRAARLVLADRKLNGCFIAPSNALSLSEHINKKHAEYKQKEVASVQAWTEQPMLSRPSCWPMAWRWARRLRHWSTLAEFSVAALQK